MDVGILAFGGYIPKARLQRGEIAKAHGWFNPALRGAREGRAVDGQLGRGQRHDGGRGGTGLSCRNPARRGVGGLSRLHELSLPGPAERGHRGERAQSEIGFADPRSGVFPACRHLGACRGSERRGWRRPAGARCGVRETPHQGGKRAGDDHRGRGRRAGRRNRRSGREIPGQPYGGGGFCRSLSRRGRGIRLHLGGALDP